MSFPAADHTPGEPVRWQHTLRIAAEPRSASPVRAFVCGHAKTAGFDGDTADEIELAVGEAVTNAILYGSGSDDEITVIIGLAASDEPAAHLLFIEVWDRGDGFDLDAVHATTPDEVDEIGGRGLPLMRALMDRVALCHAPGRGTCVRMERSLPFLA